MGWSDCGIINSRLGHYNSLEKYPANLFCGKPGYKIGWRSSSFNYLISKCFSFLTLHSFLNLHADTERSCDILVYIENYLIFVKRYILMFNFTFFIVLSFLNPNLKGLA